MMPPEFTPFKKPTGRDKNKPSREPEKLSPSILRDIFEGLTDTGLGAIGLGPDSPMNRFGAAASSLIPLGAAAKGIKNALTPSKSVIQGLSAPYKTGAHTVKNIRKLSQTPAIESYKQFTKQGMSHDDAVMAAGKGYRKLPMNAAERAEDLGGPSMVNNLDELFKGNRPAMAPVSIPPIQGGRYGADISQRMPTQNSIAMNKPMGAGSVADSEGRMLGQVAPVRSDEEQYRNYLSQIKSNLGIDMSPERAIQSKMLNPTDERLDKLLANMGGKRRK